MGWEGRANTSYLEAELLKLELEEVRLEEEELHLDEASGSEEEFNDAVKYLSLLGVIEAKQMMQPGTMVSVSSDLQKYILERAKVNPRMWAEAKKAMRLPDGALELTDEELKI